MKYRVLFFLAFQIFYIKTAFALSDGFEKPKQGLFSTYEVATFKLSAPLTTLFNAKKLSFFEIKKVTVNGFISYRDDSQKTITLPIKLHIKGYTSTKFCTFPKLELKIPASESVNTIFEGIKTLDLNTHCVEIDDPSTDPYINYVKSSFENHREAMIYRIMEILRMPSLRARPILVEYTDTDDKSEIFAKQDFAYQAFFLEDYSDFRKKNNLKAIRGINDITKFDVDPKDLEKLSTYVFSNVQDSPNIDLDDASRSALFQFLVGNRDWFIQTTKSDFREQGNPKSENIWNMKIVENSKGKWITIPQDFNFSMFMQNFPVVQPVEIKTFGLVGAESRIKILQSFVDKKDQIIEAIKTLEPSSAGPILILLDLIFKQLDSMLLDLKTAQTS